MSVFEPTAITCPKCNDTFSAPTAETVNVTRLPAARDWIMNGTFHHVTCPSCTEPIHVDRSFLYADMTRCHFILVGCRRDEWHFHDLERQTIAAFTETMLVSAPPMVKAMAPRFRVATVFGTAALAERLRLWDAGLDEAIVELMKLEALAANPELFSMASSVRLVVVAVALADDQVQLELTRSDGEAPDYVGLSLARYRELMDARESLVERYPALFHQPYVSYRRLALERVDLVAPPTDGDGPR